MPKKIAPLKNSLLADFVLRFEQLHKLKHRLDTGQHVYVRELVELLGPGVRTELNRIKHHLTDKPDKPAALTGYEDGLRRADLMHKMTEQLKRKSRNGKDNASNQYYTKKIPAYEQETLRLYCQALAGLRDSLGREPGIVDWFEPPLQAGLLTQVKPDAASVPRPLSEKQMASQWHDQARGQARDGRTTRHGARSKQLLVSQAIERLQVVYNSLDEALQASVTFSRGTGKGRDRGSVADRLHFFAV
jgi:hypothetical protein